MLADKHQEYKYLESRYIALRINVWFWYAITPLVSNLCKHV